MLAREQRLVAREGHEGGELRARGIADQPDPVGIEAASARTNCTAALVSYTAPGQVFTPGFISRYSIANTA